MEKILNIELSKKNTNIFIKIEDDGPGIPGK
jgi:signal transduction histidine kinase